MYEPNQTDIAAVIQANDLLNLQREIDTLVNDFEIETRISGFDLFCQKTGAKIGTRNENSLLALVKICGGQDVSGNLYNATTFNVHPAWIDTTPECLENLMDQDPIGYACYCFDLLTKQFYQTNKNHNARLYPSADRLWALARANAIMQERGTAGLEALNYELNRAVTFMPDSASYLFATIRKFGDTADKLAQLHASGDLIEKLAYATNYTLSTLGVNRRFSQLWVERTKFLDLAFTPETAARGPSNIRKQRVSKKIVAEAAMFNEIDKMFGEMGFDLKAQIIANTPGTGAWKEKISARKAQQDKEIELGLASLQGIVNFDMFDENNDDNNEVEVRKLALPIEEKPILHIEHGQMQESIIIPQNQPKQKLTALQILRAKKRV